MKVSAVFLDRDGVINKKPKEHDYVKKWGEFSFLPNVFAAIKKLNDHNILTIIITNQRGIARGIFTIEYLETIHKNMSKELKKHGVHIDAIYYCPHNYGDNCNCRKPKTGLLEKAAKDYSLKLEDTYFIGDSQIDIETGTKAKCKTILLTKSSNFKNWAFKPDYVTKDLYKAIELILNG